MSREKTETMPVSKPKRITLQYLLKNDLPIWVINRGHKGESGPVILQIGDKNSYTRITILPGNDPQCLTDQAPIETLRTCWDLHRVVDAGVLELLDPEKAEEYYDKNEDRKRVVQEKLQKYMYKQHQDVPAPKPIHFGDDAAEGNFKKYREDGLPVAAQTTRAKFTQSGPKPKVSDLCQRAQADAVGEKVMFEQLLEISSSLTSTDLEHIERNGHFDSVRQWAQDQMREKDSK